MREQSFERKEQFVALYDVARLLRLTNSEMGI